MKLFYNAEGRLTDIHNKDFLVQGNDGINIIEIYGPWPQTAVVTISFQRADGFVIGELTTKREDDHWYFPIEAKWNILNIPGQIQMTVSVYNNGTKQNTALFTSHVYGSITIPDEGGSYFEWYVGEKLIEHEEKINYLLQQQTCGEQIQIFDSNGNEITEQVEMYLELGVEVPQQMVASFIASAASEAETADPVTPQPTIYSNNLCPYDMTTQQYSNNLYPYDLSIPRYSNNLVPYDTSKPKYKNKLVSYNK